jgi:hypothetical protein
VIKVGRRLVVEKTEARRMAASGKLAATTSTEIVLSVDDLCDLETDAPG